MARLLPRTTRTLIFPITSSLDADAIDLPECGGGARLIELRQWERNRGRLVGEMRSAPAYIGSAACSGAWPGSGGEGGI
jgi:hypothetical protein